MPKPEIKNMTVSDMYDALIEANHCEDGEILEALMAHAEESSKAFNSTFRKPFEQLMEEMLDNQEEEGDGPKDLASMSMEDIIAELEEEHYESAALLAYMAKNDNPQTPVIELARQYLQAQRDEAASPDFAD